MPPCALLLLLLSSLPPQKTEPPETLSVSRAAGISVRVIRVNLNDPQVRVSMQTAKGMPTGAEDFSTLMARTRPTLAINGTYFSKTSLAPIGDIVIGGKVVYRGNFGTVFGLTYEKEPILQRVVRWHGHDWKGCETALGCGPALVLDGKVDVQPEQEGFSDPHIMGTTKRMGLGVTGDRHLLLVTTLSGVSFRKWAEVMKALDCRDAMNLDSGASLGMYYHGKMILRPGRKLTNVLCVFVKQPLPAAEKLAPGYGDFIQSSPSR